MISLRRAIMRRKLRFHPFRRIYPAVPLKLQRSLSVFSASFRLLQAVCVHAAITDGFYLPAFSLWGNENGVLPISSGATNSCFPAAGSSNATFCAPAFSVAVRSSRSSPSTLLLHNIISYSVSICQEISHIFHRKSDQRLLFRQRLTTPPLCKHIPPAKQ